MYYSYSNKRTFPQQMRDARSMYKEGKERYRNGDYGNALECFEKAAKLQEVLLGKYHTETINSYLWVGKSSACTVKALKAFQRAMRIGKSVLDESTYQNMIRDIEKCWNDKYPQNTHNVLQRLLQIFSYEERGDKDLKAKDYAHAIEMYCEALSCQDLIVGPDSIDGADIRCKLAIAVLRISATPEADRALKRAYECYRTIHGQDHPATLGAAAKMETILSSAAA